MISPMQKWDSSSTGVAQDIVKAAYKGDAKLVARLLDEGGDPNSVDTRDNLSLLHIACMQGDDELVDVLLDWDKKNGNLDFHILSFHRPRLAWQYAANINFFELAERVHEASLAKEDLKGPALG